jgi:hypothetical protein
MRRFGYKLLQESARRNYPTQLKAVSTGLPKGDESTDLPQSALNLGFMVGVSPDRGFPNEVFCLVTVLP